MKYPLFCTLLFLTSCNAIQGLFQDDSGIKIEVSKDAMQKKKDINLSIDVVNTPTK